VLSAKTVVRWANESAFAFVAQPRPPDLSPPWPTGLSLGRPPSTTARYSPHALGFHLAMPVDVAFGGINPEQWVAEKLKRMNTSVPIRDTQTVAPDGRSIDPVIDAVVVMRITPQEDERGEVCEMYGSPLGVFIQHRSSTFTTRRSGLARLRAGWSSRTG
jgi:hypothetical protein